MWDLLFPNQTLNRCPLQWKQLSLNPWISEEVPAACIGRLAVHPTAEEIHYDPQERPPVRTEKFLFLQSETQMFVNISLCHSQARSFRLGNSPDPIASSLQPLTINRRHIYFLKQIISIAHPSSNVILSYYFSHCPAPPYRGSETLHLGTGMNILACSAFQTLVANIMLILTARSDPDRLLARTCCECCPMKSLI